VTPVSPAEDARDFADGVSFLALKVDQRLGCLGVLRSISSLFQDVPDIPAEPPIADARAILSFDSRRMPGFPHAPGLKAAPPPGRRRVAGVGAYSRSPQQTAQFAGGSRTRPQPPLFL